MIFEETEDGMVIDISHREMICMDTEQFLVLILKARHMYKRHANADMDNDDSEEN